MEMLILVLFIAYIGGVLTILSPCILPVVPFVFARSDQPFYKTGFPMLLGMALCFVTLAFLSAAGGNWVVEANSWGRIIALAIFTILGLTLIFPQLANWMFKPVVGLGNLIQNKVHAEAGFSSSVLIGVAIGLLWTPCAGPILGLVLTSAVITGANVTTLILLMSFAFGAITSLALVFLASHKIIGYLKKGLGVGEWLKKIIGIIILFFAMGIASGLDTKVISKFNYVNTDMIEQILLDRLATNTVVDTEVLPTLQSVADPSLDGATDWLNSEPLTLESLKGKVVLIDFWTYSCINCLRTLPYLQDWANKYTSHGLFIIGVHTPEFAFEKNPENVKRAVSDLKITHPVALDNDYTIWKAFNNRYWPAHYFIDVKGSIRYFHFGEGNYIESEEILRQLLREIPTNKNLPEMNPVTPATGVQAEASSAVSSPETYLGYERQKGFVASSDLKPDAVQNYTAPAKLHLNNWSLTGAWKAEAEKSQLHSQTGILSVKFRARDLHLVLGTHTKGSKFQVTIDDQPPGKNHGEDINADGFGEIKEHRLYQLIRQQQPPKERTFKIEFFNPGVEIYAFTFG